MQVEQLAKMIKTHVREDYDCVVAITSTFEGEGKSTLGIQLSRAIDKDFTLKRNVLFSPTVEEMKNLSFELPKYSVINADEAIRVLYKLHWASRMQQFLNQLYALARKENLITMLCMPRFRDFNEFFRNHKIKIWIHVLSRGQGVIFYKDWNPFAKDPWWTDENMKQIDKYEKIRKFIDYDINQKIKALSKCRNYIGTIEFDDLDEETKKEYVELRELYKYDDLELEQSFGFETLKLYATSKKYIEDPETYGKIWQGERKLDKDSVALETGLGRIKLRRLAKIVEDAWKKEDNAVIPRAPNPIIYNRQNKPKTLDKLTKEG